MRTSAESVAAAEKQVNSAKIEKDPFSQLEGRRKFPGGGDT